MIQARKAAAVFLTALAVAAVLTVSTVLACGSTPAGPQGGVSTPAPTPATPAADPLAGIVIAPESRPVPYDRDAYPYPSSIEARIIDAQGGHFSPYTLRCFEALTETDIEHIVPTSEAHDSGMAGRPGSVKQRFATDLDNLTTAAPGLNRHDKAAKDPGEWLPPENRCWYVGVWIDVKRKYALTMDAAEAAAVRRVLEGCNDTALTRPACAP